MIYLPTDSLAQTPMEPWLKTFDVQCKNMPTKFMLTSNIWHVCLIHAEHHNYPTSFLTR